MYIDIKQLKVIQARAIAAKVGSSIIEPIMRDIKKAAAEGRESIKLEYEIYNIDNNNCPYIAYWARTCGFEVKFYSNHSITIKW